MIALVLFSAISAADWWDTAKDVLKEAPLKQIGLPSPTHVSALSTTDITAAFKQALALGSQKVVDQLGVVNGFNKDTAVRIPLPQTLQTVSKLLNSVGLGYMVDDFTLQLNRAAEQATPVAKSLFVKAVKDMKFNDVRRIYNGPNDAATRFFESSMTPDLSRAMQPIIADSLAKVGAISYYDKMMSAYKDIPFVPDVKANLTSHVSEGALAGIFHYLAQQEAAIRKDPVRQTTELLRKVFGS
jgi:type II secretory pathway component GspD/PulD (secretin)